MTALAAQAGPEAPSRRAVLGWWALAVTVRSSYVPLALCGAVMDLLAVLSAVGVRRSLIHTAALQGVLKRRGWRRALSAEAVDRALARLAGASLLPFSVDGSTISAHRLVIRVIRENLAARHSLTAVSEAAARLLDKLAESLRRRWHEDRAATGGLVEQIMALDESAARCPPGSDLVPSGFSWEGTAAALLPVRSTKRSHDPLRSGGHSRFRLWASSAFCF